MNTILNPRLIVNLNQEKFYHLCINNPELKIERSPQSEKASLPSVPTLLLNSGQGLTDLKPLQDKMLEYLASGLKLGWLINPQQKQVEIYRANQLIEIVNMPVVMSGEDVLPELNITLDY